MRLPFLIALAGSLISYGAAEAHAVLVKADPAVGSTVTASPSQLRLRFNEVVRLAGTGVQLVGPDGQARLLGPLAQDPKDARAILAPVPPGLGPGRYEINWRALSPDAHRTRGEYVFTVKP